MKQNFPWSKNDPVVTEDGTTVGRVKKTVELDNGDHILIMGDINPEVISFFPEQPSESSEIDLEFSCGVDDISNYENGVVRLPSSAREELQSIYNDKVRLKIEDDLDKIEEAVDSGPKLSGNENPEVIHEVQEKIRGFRRTIRQGINEDRFNGKGEEYLRQMDRIEEEFQDIMFGALNNGSQSSSTKQNKNTDQSSNPKQSANGYKDSEVKSEIDDFYDYMEDELVPKAEEADLEGKLKYIRKALQGVKELRAMVRGFDKSNTLKNPHKHYDTLDNLEDNIREKERKAMNMMKDKNSQSIFESISEGIKAYNEAKQATRDVRNKRRDRRDDNVRRENNVRKEERNQQPEDPYTGTKSNSSSISESASRFWNTITLKNAFSPKCPRCNRKSSSPVSGEDDVYQCDNCGNIFDTHPDSRREIDYNDE